MTSIFGYRWERQAGAQPLTPDDTLTDRALVWRDGLQGVSMAQIAAALDGLVKRSDGWPPTLPEFRALCLADGRPWPSLDEVVAILVQGGAGDGSLVARYRHPLALAIARDGGLDRFALSRASRSEALAMVKPLYHRLLAEGFPGWPEGADECPEALPKPEPEPVSAEPAFAGGLGDYVEQVLAPQAKSEVAQRELAKIRAILRRPDPATPEERRQRLAAAQAELQAQLQAAAEAGRLRLGPDVKAFPCQVPGCTRPGTLSTSITGGVQWFCREHFHR